MESSYRGSVWRQLTFDPATRNCNPQPQSRICSRNPESAAAIQNPQSATAAAIWCQKGSTRHPEGRNRSRNLYGEKFGSKFEI